MVRSCARWSWGFRVAGQDRFGLHVLQQLSGRVVKRPLNTDTLVLTPGLLFPCLVHVRQFDFSANRPQRDVATKGFRVEGFRV